MFGDFTRRKMVLAELPGAIESQTYDGVRHQKVSFLVLDHQIILFKPLTSHAKLFARQQSYGYLYSILTPSECDKT